MSDVLLLTRQDAVDDLTRRGFVGEYSEPWGLPFFPSHGPKRDGHRPCLLHGLLDAHKFSIGDRDLICSGCMHF